MQFVPANSGALLWRTAAALTPVMPDNAARPHTIPVVTATATVKANTTASSEIVPDVSHENVGTRN
jgi:hypothetical protein